MLARMEPDDAPEIDVHEAKRRVSEGSAFVDVREPEEHANVRIPGTALLPLSEVEARWRELPADREVVVHCRSGARSARVTAFLRERGIDAVNVAGGILDWQEAGYPVERD